METLTQFQVPETDPILQRNNNGKPFDMAWVVSYWPGYFVYGLGIFIHENAQAGHTVLVALL